MEDIEEVGEGAQDGDEDAKLGVYLQASRATHCGEEEVERVHEEREEAGHKEHLVPICHDVAVRV